MPEGCGQYIPIKLLVDHKLHHCEEREIKCEKCLTPESKRAGQALATSLYKAKWGMPYVRHVYACNTSYPYHKENLCLKREVKCRFAGAKLLQKILKSTR